MIRGIWATVGMLCLALGVVGLFLPLSAHGSISAGGWLLLWKIIPRRLHRWLLNHPVLGPPIHDWNARGAISTNAKRLATLSVAAALVISPLPWGSP